MANIKLTRVDFRLIHGQVMTRWVMDLGINKIIVIDDKTFKNPITSKVLKMAAPSGVDVQLYNVEGAVEKWNDDNFGGGNILILFKDISTAKRVYEAGINYGKLQIGGVGGGSNQKSVYKNVSLSEEDYNLLKEMHENNMDIYLQPIPEDKPYDFATALGNKVY